jgi:hypothetical protein
MNKKTAGPAFDLKQVDVFPQQRSDRVWPLRICIPWKVAESGQIRPFTRILTLVMSGRERQFSLMNLSQPRNRRLLTALHCLLNGHVPSNENDRYHCQEQAGHPGRQLDSSGRQRGYGARNSDQYPYGKKQKASKSACVARGGILG